MNIPSVTCQGYIDCLGSIITQVVFGFLSIVLHCNGFVLSPDAKALVEIDPKLQASKDSVARLEKLQTEKSEKMKEEALGEFRFCQ